MNPADLRQPLQNALFVFFTLHNTKNWQTSIEHLLQGHFKLKHYIPLQDFIVY